MTPPSDEQNKQRYTGMNEDDIYNHYNSQDKDCKDRHEDDVYDVYEEGTGCAESTDKHTTGSQRYFGHDGL